MSPLDADVATEQALAAESVTDEDSSSPSVAANTLGAMHNPNTAEAGYDTVDQGIFESVRQRVKRGGALLETPLERLNRERLNNRSRGSTASTAVIPEQNCTFIPRTATDNCASCEEAVRSVAHGLHTLVIGVDAPDEFVDSPTNFDDRGPISLSTPPLIAMTMPTPTFAEEGSISSGGSAALNPTPLLAPDPGATDSSSRNRTGVLARVAALFTGLFQK